MFRKSELIQLVVLYNHDHGLRCNVCQVQYAASDVAVTLDILTALVNIRMSQMKQSRREGLRRSISLQNLTTLILYLEATNGGGGGSSIKKSLLDSQAAHSLLISLCKPLVDLPYHQPKTHTRPQVGSAYSYW